MTKSTIYTLLLIFFIAFTKVNVNAQITDINIIYNASKEFTLNKMPLNEKMKVKSLIKLLGEPTKITSHPRTGDSYFYEEDGIVFFIKDDTLEGFGINYNSDGDERFPTKTFIGTLKMGDFDIDKDTKIDAFTNNDLIDFECQNAMCFSKEPIKSMLAFEEGKLTQIMFSFQK